MGFLRTTTDGSEYGYNSFKVVVRTDGSINVKSGDSLSKYSKAIYGDFSDMDRKFGRSNGSGVKSFRDLNANINLIRSGETVYQMTRYNTRGGNGGPETVTPKPGGAPVEKTEMDRRFAEALNYIGRVAWIGSEWRLKGMDSGGIGFNTPLVKLGGAIDGLKIQVQRAQDAAPTTLWGASLGFTIGVSPDLSIMSLSIPVAGITGCILKGPGAGTILTKDELSGKVVLLELSVECFGGVAGQVLFGGPSVTEFFTVPGKSLGRIFLPKWAIISTGFTFNPLEGLATTGKISHGYIRSF